MKQVIAAALNRYLALDSESKRRLLRLNNKVVTIELRGVGLTLQFIIAEEKIQLRWEDFLPADLTIKGTPLTFLHMHFVPEQRSRFFAEDVTVEGNMELAQQVLALFDDLEIDWEEQLSHYVGDVAAHHLGRAARDAKTFSQRLRRTLLKNVNEYTHEEIALFPPTEALQDFFRDVDELRMDVDRLAVRLEQCEKDINK